MSPEEIQAVRWILSNYDVLDNDLLKHCPFAYYHAKKALETLGGKLETLDPTLVEEFEAETQNCHYCGDTYFKDQLTYDKAEKQNRCPDCFKPFEVYYRTAVSPTWLFYRDFHTNEMADQVAAQIPIPNATEVKVVNTQTDDRP